MIGMKDTNGAPSEPSVVVVADMKNSVEKHHTVNKIIDSKMANVNLNFTDVPVDYLLIVDWLKDNIWLDQVTPFLGDFAQPNNIESDISRVTNILAGKGFSGTIELTKVDVPTASPAKNKMEVTLL